MPYFVRLFLGLSIGSWLITCTSPRTEQTAQTPAADTIQPSSAPATPPPAQSVAEPAALPTPNVPAEQVVTALYETHNAKKSPFFQSESKARIRQYFSSDMAELIWQDAQITAKGELSLLGADPLYNAQDTDIKEFAIEPAQVRGNEAEVHVTFSNSGAKKTFTFLLTNEGGNWRIGDILYGDGSQLFQMLSGRAEETP
jgi:hypothetical protein